MSDKRLLEHIAAFARKITYDGMPHVVLASIGQSLIDTVGVSLAAVSLETCSMVTDYVLAQNSSGPSDAMGVTKRLPAADAAFINGTLAHALDFDDTHLPSIVHASACVIPAALAVGQAMAVSGKRLMAGIGVGLEVAVRMGMAGYDVEQGRSRYVQRGQHVTSICGTLGAAASAAKLFGLTSESIADAVSIAVSMASGVLEANRFGGTVKRLHCGASRDLGPASRVSLASLPRFCRAASSGRF